MFFYKSREIDLLLIFTGPVSYTTNPFRDETIGRWIRTNIKILFLSTTPQPLWNIKTETNICYKDYFQKGALLGQKAEKKFWYEPVDIYL